MFDNAGKKYVCCVIFGNLWFELYISFRVNRNWSYHYVILQDGMISFYKDLKTARETVNHLHSRSLTLGLLIQVN